MIHATAIGPQAQFLNPSAVVQIFRPAHSVSADTVVNGIPVLKLSDKGERQATLLGQQIGASKVKFDFVFCDAGAEAYRTAILASNHFENEAWSNKLVKPMTSSDLIALQALQVRCDQEFKAGQIQSPYSYNIQRKRDDTGVLNRYMDYVRQGVSFPHGIERAIRIAIFAPNSPVLVNAIAEALYPQHGPTLAGIITAPCDHINIGATGCVHVRFTP